MSKEDEEYAALGRLVLGMASEAFAFAGDAPFFGKRELTFADGASCILVLIRNQEQLEVIGKAMQVKYEIADIKFNPVTH